MQKVTTIVLSIAVIFGIQLWQIDSAYAGDYWGDKFRNNRRCDPSGLWITEPDSDTGAQVLQFWIPLDPAKKKYAATAEWVVPFPTPEDVSIINAGGVVERVSRCTFNLTAYWYTVSESGEILFTTEIYGENYMEDNDTISFSGFWKMFLPDGTQIDCGELTGGMNRLKAVPPSEWPCTD